MTRQTYIVESTYVGRDGKPRVFVKNNPLPFHTDEPLSEGDAVVLIGSKAVKAR